MAINSQSFGQIVSNAVAAIQGAATALLDFTVGSVLLAVTQATAGIALWLQALILQVAALTRASTSTGTNLDSFYADFNFPRLLATSATGVETFSRATATASALIQAAVSTGIGSNGQPLWSGGAQVQTPDGTQVFMVIPNTSLPLYNAGTNQYQIPAGTQSAQVQVFALNAGSAGNVAPGGVSVLSQAILGIDTVTNALIFTGGLNQETDSQYRARFPGYLQSLSAATVEAIQQAVEDLQEGASAIVVQNQTMSGVFQAGYFFVICNDGTGNPSQTFLNECSNAINVVKPVNTLFNVFAPVRLPANISMTISVSTGYVLATAETQVESAIASYISGLATGATLPYSYLSVLAYGVQGVNGVTSILLNGTTNDLVPSAVQLVTVGTLTVN